MRAEQSDAAGNVGFSVARTFTVTGSDTVAPVVSLNAPPVSSTDSTPTFAGVAGVAVGDASTVTVRVHAGSSVAGGVVQSLVIARNVTSGAYSVDAAVLAPGTYTARTEQSDGGGNVGYSVARTFTVVAGADVTPPVVTVGIETPTSDTTPVISGYGGWREGDSGLVTIRVFAGSGTSGRWCSRSRLRG